MINTKKLVACLLAAGVTHTGATHLARPAEAVTTVGECSADDRAYARAYAILQCSLDDMAGRLDSCNLNGSFSYTCYYEN